MMISLGFLGAASVRVVNELGRGDSKTAKFSILNVVITSFTIGFVLFIVFLFLHERVAYVFTNDHEVAAEVAHLSPLLAFSILLNSVHPVLSGVAIGAGWQSLVVYVNLASYYLLGIPCGFILGYYINLQVEVVIARGRVNKWFVEAPEPTGVTCLRHATTKMTVLREMCERIENQ